MSENIAIGIDIGTSFSCVAVFKNGQIKLITDSEGCKKTPSEVAFKESKEELVGMRARKQGGLNPTNTIFNIKRLIGRSSEEVKAISTNLPFAEVLKEPNVMVLGETLSPERFLTMLLKKAKDTAEQNHKPISNAVIAVPANFNEKQREAMEKAAKKAGLNDIQLIKETTAAALAYGFEKKIAESQNVMIFDFGGGKLDVSIIKISPNSSYEELATTGDTNFGGTDFDEKLLEHFAKEFEDAHPGKIAKNPRSMRRLRTACEETKKSLSGTIDTSIEVDSLFNGIDFESEITRAEFEELCKDLFDSILKFVKKALSEAKMDKSKIDEIVLVGGSTRIPKVQQLLTDFFSGKALNHSVNPDEAVVIGAAIQATVISGAQSNHFGKITVHEIEKQPSEGMDTTNFVQNDKSSLRRENSNLIDETNLEETVSDKEVERTKEGKMKLASAVHAANNTQNEETKTLEDPLREEDSRISNNREAAKKTFEQDCSKKVQNIGAEIVEKERNESRNKHEEIVKQTENAVDRDGAVLQKDDVEKSQKASNSCSEDGGKVSILKRPTITEPCHPITKKMESEVREVVEALVVQTTESLEVVRDCVKNHEEAKEEDSDAQHLEIEHPNPACDKAEKSTPKEEENKQVESSSDESKINAQDKEGDCVESDEEAKEKHSDDEKHEPEQFCVPESAGKDITDNEKVEKQDFEADNTVPKNELTEVNKQVWSPNDGSEIIDQGKEGDCVENHEEAEVENSDAQHLETEQVCGPEPAGKNTAENEKGEKQNVKTNKTEPKEEPQKIEEVRMRFSNDSELTGQGKEADTTRFSENSDQGPFQKQDANQSEQNGHEEPKKDASHLLPDKPEKMEKNKEEKNKSCTEEQPIPGDHKLIVQKNDEIETINNRECCCVIT